MRNAAARSTDGSTTGSLDSTSQGAGPGKSTLTSQPPAQATAPGKSTLTGQAAGQGTATASGVPAKALPVGRAVVNRDCSIRDAPSKDGALVTSKPDWVARGTTHDVYGVTRSWLQILHAERPAYITGGSEFVTYTPLPPPAVEPVAPQAPETPAAAPSMLDQVTGAVGDAVDSVTSAIGSAVDSATGAVQTGLDGLTRLGNAALAAFGIRPSEPTPEEDKQLQTEPVDPATGEPTDPAAPPTDIAAVDGTKHFVQTEWYGADGELLAAPLKATCKTVLASHDILDDYRGGSRGEVYNDVLKLPSDQRPSTVTTKHKLRDDAGNLVKDEKGNQQYSDSITEPVPADVQTLPQLKFIPGEASCLRTAEAMAAESGATIEEGSGVPTSHIQMILSSDQEAVLDENGEPLNHKGELAGKGRQARQTKSTEDITADAGADHLAQIQANVALASAFMDAELSAGRAVVIGVSYTNRDGNEDKVTDHWMCVHAKVGGGYAYFDPGASGDNGKGILQANPDKGGILEGRNGGKIYSLAQVRLNQQSSGAPAPGDIDRSMKEVAADVNGKLQTTSDAPAAP